MTGFIIFILVFLRLFWIIVERGENLFKGLSEWIKEKEDKIRMIKSEVERLGLRKVETLYLLINLVDLGIVLFMLGIFMSYFKGVM